MAWMSPAEHARLEAARARAYCHPHKPGELWIMSVHGVVLPTAAKLRSLYRDDFVSSMAEQAGIPTGAPIPVEVLRLVERAACWKSNVEAREPLLAQAKALLEQAATEVEQLAVAA